MPTMISCSPPEDTRRKQSLSYITGVALGDGNISNPNGRALRLRITCDIQYPKIISTVTQALRILLPKNKVSLVKRRDGCIDISCYSNKWKEYLWNAGNKYSQNVRVPDWIKANKAWTKQCLRGLIETDGSIYFDRGYLMVNFTTTIPILAQDVREMITEIGATSTLSVFKGKNRPRYTIRIATKTEDFLKEIRMKHRKE